MFSRNPCLAVLAVLIAGVTTIGIGPNAQAVVLLSDDFNDNSIDSAKWNVVLSGIPQNPKSVTETGGQMRLEGRGHLNTVQQFDPASGGLRITGTWTFGTDDFLQILTRSNGTPGGSYGETNSGIELFAFTGNNQIQLREMAGSSGTTLGGPVNLPSGISNGSIFDFDFTDDGVNLSATLTEVGNPANTATVTATSSSVMPSNLVVFHNRETGRVAQLDNVVISNLAPAPPPQLTDGLMAYWNFDEPTGNPFVYPDVAVSLGSGNVDDSTFSGGGNPMNIAGKVGPGALHLDGNDVVYANFSQDIGQAGSPNNITTAMSVQAWVHMESLTNSQNIFAKRHTNNTSGWVLETSGDNLNWWFNNVPGSGGWNLVTGTDVVGDNQDEWMHLVLTWESGDKMRMYVNGGAPFESAADIGGTSYMWNDLLGFGAWAGIGRYYTGALDEVAIWNRQLSADEVATLFNNGAGMTIGAAPVPEPSTLALAALGLLGLAGAWRRRKRI